MDLQLQWCQHQARWLLLSGQRCCYWGGCGIAETALSAEVWKSGCLQTIQNENGHDGMHISSLRGWGLVTFCGVAGDKRTVCRCSCWGALHEQRTNLAYALVAATAW
jgi:hypothetical protein